ncbi:aminotransferase class I/II-fold pyridoxal phosphate-dependent enzyme [Caldibacillus lycopersici]|uniref:Aminotransferase class I/II-fold pyridoxal phosphate-dependent enzyme n=1 Tax=Perspicuibacillus lycopersici TaxID=1325689 RepID=A0AAE3LPV1_9BACI|nr:aminotransferase class I/II-fold pyridoxal phosphate-dependent enzyme [Perspicuibacillus lycopersici]MCU9615312.1 aminotransferase class I/II-fold pyridoxal phosphate-dependent enzyme [Perspicuibacillus lycopersici]
MEKKMMMPLVQALINHNKNQPVSFHVPGHKNGMLLSQDQEITPFFQAIMQIDQTELSRLDDLHAPEGAIEEAQQLLSDLYNTNSSFFLVNGSTVGNIAMILATFREGDEVLVQRNSHQSIMNGLELANVQPIFLAPNIDKTRQISGEVEVSFVKEALEKYPNIKGIILTNPNYYGINYSIKEIINLAHSRSIPVLVDEAHGAHFVIGEPFPKSALEYGADIVVHSAHKTLPAMTMGSYLHFNSSLISLQKVKDYLRMLQSSSPSYPIMASLDYARGYVASYTKEDLKFLVGQIRSFMEELDKLKDITVIKGHEYYIDPLKITIQSTMGFSGYALQRALEEQSIFAELADLRNVLLIFPLLKSGVEYPIKDTIIRIKKAIKSLQDSKLHWNSDMDILQYEGIRLSHSKANYQKLNQTEKEVVPFEQSVGQISFENIIPYPPGIPVILKGEIIVDEHILLIEKLVMVGAKFHGGDWIKERKIMIVKNEM